MRLACFFFLSVQAASEYAFSPSISIFVSLEYILKLEAANKDNVEINDIFHASLVAYEIYDNLYSTHLSIYSTLNGTSFFLL